MKSSEFIIEQLSKSEIRQLPGSSSSKRPISHEKKRTPEEQKLWNKMSWDERQQAVRNKKK